jgi:peptide/nickel transport system substrate-binding protein
MKAWAATALASLSIVATACAFSACARVSSGVTGGGSAHALRIGIVSDPRSLNPLFVTAQSDIDISQLYTETLVGLSPQNELIPLLADPVPTVENGGVSRDGMTITYHLRRNARFADGVPFTSKDVAFTYRAILDPRNPVTASDQYRRIASLDTPDAHTVVVHLKHRWTAAVSELFAVSDWVMGILPAHAFTSTDVNHSAWYDHAFGTGPFSVARWLHGDRIELVPNPYAWRTPRLHRLTVRILPDQTTLYVAAQTGEVDLANLTEEEIAQAERVTGAHIVKALQNHTFYVEYQVERPPVNDPLVRRALAEAIDRAAIARTVYLGYQPQATTEIPPVFSEHDASIPAWRYDPAAAAADFERAGWRLRDGMRYKDGQPLSLLFAYVSTSVQARRLAAIYQSDLARVGVSLLVKGYPSTLFFGSAASGGIERGGNFDLAYTEWWGGSDPEESAAFTCINRAPNGANTSRWCDPAYDAYYAQQTVIPDGAARTAAFHGMQRVAHAGLLGDFLVTTTGYTLVRDRVEGFAPNMILQYGNSDGWDVR